MSYYTTEYTVLKNNTDGSDVTIKPNKDFEQFEGDFTVTSFARVRDRATGAVIAELEAGSKVKGIGTVAKPKAIAKRLLEE